MSHGGPITVLLVDDFVYVGETLTRAFAAAAAGAEAGGTNPERIELVGQLLRPDDLPAIVRQRRPDVVLMDFLIPGCDTIQAVTSLLRACPTVAVVMYTGVINSTERRLMLESGAIACVGKYQPTEDLFAAIREAAAWSRIARETLGDSPGGAWGAVPPDNPPAMPPPPA